MTLNHAQITLSKAKAELAGVLIDEAENYGKVTLEL
jgi:hypothetical protein